MTLYIDPGTGSMLFTILIGLLGAAIYAIREFWVKLKFLSGGGSIKNNDGGRIPFVIFTDSKRYFTIFKPICDEMEKRGQELLYLTADADDPMLNEQYEHIKTEFAGEGNKTYARMNMLKADIVLSSTPGLDIYQWKRSKDVKCYAHVLHGAYGVTLYKMFGCDYYDTLLLSGKYQIDQVKALEALRNLPPKEIRLVGLPTMDALREKYLQSEPPMSHVTTVIIAPTWGPQGLLSKYGKKIIEKLLETDYHIIIRPHPQSFISEKETINSLLEAFPENDKLEWDRSANNFNSLNRSDIMISDFSSVIFDYALIFEKPVIYSIDSFDDGIYDAWWLEERDWIFTALERIGMELSEDNINNIDSFVDQCLSDNKYKIGIDQVKEETWCNIGDSVNAIVDYMIQKKEELS